jgi:hypothetical protein
MKRLALHITWGTYGTRLHGDPRGTVDRYNNEHGAPVVGFVEHRWEQEKSNLKFPPVVLTRPQMIHVEEQLPIVCERGYWKHIVGAAGPNHVHEILDATFDPETIRRLLKRWLGQSLTERWPLPDGATWWAECGSIRWVDNERYYANATRYVTDQRASA